MRLPIIMLAILLVTNLLTDWYIWICLRLRCRSRKLPRIHVAICIALYIFLGVTLCIPRRDGSDAQLLAVMWMLFGYFTVYIPKYLFLIFDFIASLPKLFHGHRMKWLTWTGASLGIVLFGAMWWGALVNREHTQIIEEDIWIPDLPEAFDGYRIVQISDFHVGTYGSDTAFVSQVVDRINELHPDAVAFTGDIVNRRSEEIQPFVRPLSRLKGKDGVYSILGNHDYGDYSDWSSEEAKKENLDLLVKSQEKMSWKLLLNDHLWLKKGNDSILIIGVENIGDPPFKEYGNLSKAYPAIGDSNVKILLSHNPAHWTRDIEKNDTAKIALTLAGHTHAMQMEAFGVSPAVFRYPKWGGLYKNADSSRQLYVNIGLGTVGIPMRLGATPEITVLTLRRGAGPLSNETTSDNSFGTAA